jgi:hypothetical protein
MLLYHAGRAMLGLHMVCTLRALGRRCASLALLGSERGRRVLIELASLIRRHFVFDLPL